MKTNWSKYVFGVVLYLILIVVNQLILKMNSSTAQLTSVFFTLLIVICDEN